MSTSFQPLYKQVYDVLTQRLQEGYWKPGDLLPSEFALADELGVSQGTVRKALNQLVTEYLLDRQQGKGTFVAEHTQESSLFRFFRWREPGGEKLIPETTVISQSRKSANVDQQQKLGLPAGAEINELVRVRSLLDQITLLEFVVQPLSVFPDIDLVKELPNSLYTLYQERYGISIISARDELRAEALPKKFAKHLNLPPQHPVLVVERLSINTDGRAVEYSTAYCSTESFSYVVNLK